MPQQSNTVHRQSNAVPPLSIVSNTLPQQSYVHFAPKELCFAPYINSAPTELNSAQMIFTSPQLSYTLHRIAWEFSLLFFVRISCFLRAKERFALSFWAYKGEKQGEEFEVFSSTASLKKGSKLLFRSFCKK